MGGAFNPPKKREGDMELNNGEIWMAKPALDKLMQLDLPWKTSLAMSKLSMKLNTEYLPIEQTRLGLVKKYGKVDKGNPEMMRVDASNGNYPKYMEAFVELMNTEVKVDIEKVMSPESMDEAIEIKPNTLMVLEKFVGVS